MKIKRMCKECGKEFSEYPSRIKEGRGIFCSKNCMGEWYSLHLKGKNSPRWNGGKEKYICAECGKEVVRYSREKREMVFCSRECHGKWLSKNQTGKNNSAWKDRKIKRICQICGRKFEVFISRINENRGFFCSKECYSVNQSITLKGEDSPFWQGGLSFEPYCYKFNNDLKERVREFFDRKCYVCGLTEEENEQRLSVHHVNYDKMVCCNNVPPLFVPLCQRHHNMSNYNRGEWQEFFEVSLQYLTQNKCFYTQEEMIMNDKVTTIRR